MRNFKASNFRASLGIVFLLTSFSVHAETCGGYKGDLNCCDNVSTADNVTCAVPAGIKYEFTVNRFGFEKDNGDIVWIGSEGVFDAASADIGTVISNYAIGVTLPVGTYVAVRPEIKKEFTVNGGVISTTDNKTCSTGGAKTGDYSTMSNTEGETIPLCSNESNADWCDIGNGYIRARNDTLGNIVITDGSAPSINFQFDLGSGMLFTTNAGNCSFKSIGFMNVFLTLN